MNRKERESHKSTQHQEDIAEEEEGHRCAAGSAASDWTGEGPAIETPARMCGACLTSPFLLICKSIKPDNPVFAAPLELLTTFLPCRSLSLSRYVARSCYATDDGSHPSLSGRRVTRLGDVFLRSGDQRSQNPVTSLLAEPGHTLHCRSGR